MRFVLALLFFGSALAAESPREIDPNTKIEGGADVPAEQKTEKQKPVIKPEKSESEKDKPISERKPQEREREEASRGESKNAPQQ